MEILKCCQVFPLSRTRLLKHFAGFQLTGRFRAGELVSLIRQLPEGTTEFMCHPGCVDKALEGAATRLVVSRQHELDALLAAESRAALTECGVELVTYRDLQ